MASESTDETTSRFNAQSEKDNLIRGFGEREGAIWTKANQVLEPYLENLFCKTSGKVCLERYTEALSKVTVPNLAAEGKFLKTVKHRAVCSV